MNPYDPNYNSQQPQFPQAHPSPEMSPRAEKMRAIWRIIASVYALAATVLVIYWEFTSSGLSDQICQLQASILNSDSCYIALNLCVSMLILLVPLLIAKILTEKITGIKLVNGTLKH